MRSSSKVRLGSFVLSRKSSIGESFAGLSLIAIALLVLSTYRGCTPANVSPLLVPRMPSESVRASAGELPKGVGIGNGLLDGRPHAGWFVGHFMDEGTVQHSNEVEAKFTFNPTGKRKAHYAVNKISKTMTVLISGSHRLEFANSSVVLDRPGDYAIFGEGVGHTWVALQDSTILTIRWPSLPGDQIATNPGKETSFISKGVMANK